MIDNLKRLSVVVCASKVFGTPMRGYDGQCESDSSRLKKGIRSNYNLQWHEAWYKALDQNGLLDAFRAKVSEYGAEPNLNRSGHGNTVDDAIKYNMRQAEIYKENAKQSPQHYDHYMRHAHQAEALVDAFRIMKSVEQQAEDFFEALPLNRSKNIDWKNIDSVQFYAYTPSTNSFEPFDHKGK